MELRFFLKSFSNSSLKTAVFQHLFFHFQLCASQVEHATIFEI